QIEQLNVVVLEKLIEGLGRVEGVRRVEAGQLVAPVKGERQETALVQLDFGQGGAGLALGQLGKVRDVEIGIHGAQAHVVEQDGGTVRLHLGLLWIGQQSRKVVAGKLLERRRPLRLGQAGQADEGGKQVEMAGQRRARLVGLAGGARDD